MVSQSPVSEVGPLVPSWSRCRTSTVRPADDNEDEPSATVTKHQVRGRRHQGRGRKPADTQGGGAVYGLWLIGALVWYWQQAEELSEHVVAALKALLWPALLVYDALKALNSLTTKGGSEGE